MANRPKPTHLKLVQGNPGKRAIPKREPKPSRGIPRCPSYLTDEARRAWRELSKVADGMGVLTVADGKALELAAVAYDEFRQADDQVRAQGMTYETTTPTGDRMIRPHPAVSIRSDAWRKFRLAIIEFGLTPAARTKVRGGQDVSDPLDEFLNGGSK